MNWFEIKALATGREICIYNDIGGDGITAKMFKNELDKGNGPITVRINSVGGVVTEGLAIYNMLKQYQGHIAVKIDALAASMATVVAMAGDTITMQKNSLFMIHNPWGVTLGDAKQHSKTADLLEKMQVSMVDIYHSKTGIDKDLIRSMMDAETWLDSFAAQKNGFIDSIEGVADESIVNEQKGMVAIAKIEQVKQSNRAYIKSLEAKGNKFLQTQSHRLTSSGLSEQHQIKSTFQGIKHV